MKFLTLPVEFHYKEHFLHLDSASRSFLSRTEIKRYFGTFLFTYVITNKRLIPLAQ